MRTRLLVAAGATVWMLGTGANAQETSVVVWPDAPVGAETRPYVEFDIATSPADPGRLLVAGYGLGSEGSSVRLSTDGGWSWVPVVLPEQVRRGGADPQVTFLPSGEAVFVALSREPGQFGRPANGISIFHSPDGGEHWEEAALLTDAGYDRPLLAVAPDGPGADGTLYLLVRVPAQGAVVLRRSEDGGRTWGPAATVAQSSTEALLVFGLEALPGGGLVVPILRSTGAGLSLEVVTSDDGGRSFSAPVPVARPVADTAMARARVAEGVGALGPSWGVASDPRSGRVYLAFRGDSPDGSRILLSTSGDRGRSWSEPTVVSSGPGHHTQATLAVDTLGTVGLSWVAATGGEAGWRQDVWFSASTDDGETFLGPRRLTSRPSAPAAAGNRVPVLRTLRLDSSTVILTGSSALSRFPTGGDYFGMAVDGFNRFRPVWADTRMGHYQAWTTAVAVGEPTAAQPSELGPPAHVPFLDLRIDHIEVHGDSAVAWVRIQNTGDVPVWGPIRVEPAGARSGRGAAGRGGARGARGGSPGIAVDYTDALGDPGMLSPGAVTEARRWVIPLDPDGSTPRGGIRVVLMGRLVEDGG